MLDDEDVDDAPAACEDDEGDGDEAEGVYIDVSWTKRPKIVVPQRAVERCVAHQNKMMSRGFMGTQVWRQACRMAPEVFGKVNAATCRRWGQRLTEKPEKKSKGQMKVDAATLQEILELIYLRAYRHSAHG